MSRARFVRPLTAAFAAALALSACSDQITQPEAAKKPIEAPAGGPDKTVLPTGVWAPMAPGGPFNVRTGPSTAYSVGGTVAGNQQVLIVCTSQGQSVAGYYGTSNLWDKLSNGYWVADANVYTGRAGAVARPCVFDDYPYKNGDMNGVDAWGYYIRQCTSFAAYRVNTNGTRSGQRYHNWYLGVNFGDAHTWDDRAREKGIPVSTTPAVGRIAQWNPGVGGASSAGHVAYVAEVYSNDDILIEEYNWSYGKYGTRRITRYGGAWPSNFIDF